MRQQSIAPIVEAIEKQNDPVSMIAISVASGLMVVFILYLVKFATKDRDDIRR
jgi:hypothetical protein